MSSVTVRPLQRSDRDEWSRLWSAYLAFYETSLPEEVYTSTWERLFAEGNYEPRAMIAEMAGRPVGLVHFLFHRTCWAIGDNCYLQDLYADPDSRGRGVGRALIEAVYEVADRAGAANVYWTTQHFNDEARKLYDRIGVLTPFIKYQRS